MGFLKNSLRFILISLFFLITLYLLILMLLYFSIDINKIKNYSKTFITNNSNLELNFDAVTISFFPTIDLNYSQLVLNTQEDKTTEIFKSSNVKIVINPYKFIVGNFIIDVFFEDSTYNYTDYKVDFSNIPYTYASFLFFSKYNIYLDALNVKDDENVFFKIKSHIHLDPLKQEAYANSNINYLTYNFNLNTKFLISNKDIFESFIFALNTNNINNQYIIKGKLIKNDNAYELKDLNLNLNKENILILAYNFDLKDSLNLFLTLKHSLNNNLFSVFKFLEAYLNKDRDSFYEAKFNFKFSKNNVYFNGEMLFNNINIKYKDKNMDIEKFIILLEYLNNKLSISVSGFNKNVLIFKDSI